MLREKRIESDVLIIGGGAAGGLSALKADEMGVKVVLVNKVPWLGGTTMIARGSFSAALGYGDPQDNPSIHLRDTIIAGDYIVNQKIVKKICDEIVKVTYDLIDWGSTFVTDIDGKLDQGVKPAASNTYPRRVHFFGHTGKAVMDGISNEIKRRKIKVIDNTFVINLLKNKNAVGAIGFQWRKGELIIFNSKTTILATGGTGHLYKFSDTPPYITGDGHAMAFRVGAELVDMEFNDYQLATYYPPKLKRYPPNCGFWLTNGGLLFNINGERFIKKYYPDKIESQCSRIEISRAVWNEILDGNGTPNNSVYLNLSSVPSSLREKRADIIEHYMLAGIDLSWQPMELTPGNHTSLGGIKINERCESTSVKHLYAAGEVAGGWGGSNRLGGNALTAALSLGSIAGKYAAKKSQKIKMPVIDEKKIEKEHNRLIRFLDRNEGTVSLEIKKEVQDLMQSSVFLRRKEKGLVNTLDKLKEIEETKLPNIFIPKGRDIMRYLYLREALETINIVQLGKIVTITALTRTESRGSHQRENYPKMDNKNWLKNVVIQMKEGLIKINMIPITFSEEKAPVE